MDAETIATRTTLATHMRALAQAGRPKMDIVLLPGGDGRRSEHRPASPHQVPVAAAAAAVTAAAAAAPPPAAYTTGDHIHGEVVVTTALHETRFDQLEISFDGVTRTVVEKMSAAAVAGGGPSRFQAQQLFLRMRQPVDESMLPQPRIIEPGRVYRFPFTFVVPERLLPHSCGHDCDNEQVREAHLRLPPSLGSGGGGGGAAIAAAASAADASESAAGNDYAQPLDDMAPTMARIEYAIRVKLLRKRERDGRDVLVGEATRRVRIVPAFDEEPPLRLDDDNEDHGNNNGHRHVSNMRNGPNRPGGSGSPGSSSEPFYQLRRCKNVRRGLFKGRLGSLAIEAVQPRGLQLSSPSQSLASNTADTAAAAATAAAAEERSGTVSMVTLVLRFDPAAEKAPPPRLGQLASRLHVHTFFGTAGAKGFPDRQAPAGGAASACPAGASAAAAAASAASGSYSESLPLSCRRVASARWQRHDGAAATRKSAMSDNTGDDGDDDDDDDPDSANNIAAIATSEGARRRRSAQTGSSSGGGGGGEDEGDIPAPTPAYRGGRFYTARLAVPVMLPRNKALVPTFHSCLVSRVYALELALTAHAPKQSRRRLSAHTSAAAAAAAAATTTSHGRDRSRQSHHRLLSLRPWRRRSRRYSHTQADDASDADDADDDDDDDDDDVAAAKQRTEGRGDGDDDGRNYYYYDGGNNNDGEGEGGHGRASSLPSSSSFMLGLADCALMMLAPFVSRMTTATASVRLPIQISVPLPAAAAAAAATALSAGGVGSGGSGGGGSGTDGYNGNGTGEDRRNGSNARRGQRGSMRGEAGAGAVPAQTLAEAEAEGEDTLVEHFFRPRVISAPAEEYMRTSLSVRRASATTTTTITSASATTSPATTPATTPAAAPSAAPAAAPATAAPAAPAAVAAAAAATTAHS